MGQVLWISGLAASMAVVWTVASSGPDSEVQETNLSYMAMERVEPEEPQVPNRSALATAAFGMSALHPATYDRNLVIDIIQASPLSQSEKTRLNGYLDEAAAGDENLSVVLRNVRIALAVN
ncbi:hypothetical protein N9L47_05380 [Rhodobacteraceae bacterium]|nr:hypothetical protein [Paracoccaceae bacterium]